MVRHSWFGHVSHSGPSPSPNSDSRSNFLLQQSVHCSTFDPWWVQLDSIGILWLTSDRTLRLIFDDLQAACSDLGTYCKFPSSPPYGRYVRWLESRVDEAGSTFWLTHHTVFDNLAPKFPVLGPGGLPSISTMNTKKFLHLPKVADTEFSLPIMGRTYFLELSLPSFSNYRVWMHL